MVPTQISCLFFAQVISGLCANRCMPVTQLHYFVYSNIFLFVCEFFTRAVVAGML